VDHRADAAQGLAPGAGVPHFAEVTKGDPHVNAVAPQAAWITHQGANVLAPIDQKRQKRLTHGAGGTCHQNHA
jgi:hypothetical protein